MKGNRELVPLYILDYCRRCTNEDNPRQFKEIIEMLRDEYDLTYSRQTVESKIDTLIEEGWLERAGRKKGAYFGNREFDESELMLLIYSVLSNKAISSIQANDLVNRLAELGGEYFDASDIRIVGRDDSISGAGNQELFLNLEKVHDALRNKRQLEFDYCKYGIDMMLAEYAHYVVSPYHVAMKNQKLYLLSGYEAEHELRFFRIEHMKNAAVIPKKAVDISKMSGYEKGMELSSHTASLPYMFSDKPMQISFRADASIINQIIDWFGKDITVQNDPEDDKYVLATIRTSPIAMKYWALQYLDCVEILAPLGLRDEIHRSLSDNTEKYASKVKVPKLPALEKSAETEEMPDDIAPGKLSDLNHEFEDPGIKELDYFFKLKAEKLIPMMFKNTDENGLLNVPIDPNHRPESRLGKRYYRCIVDWNRERMEEISEEFITVRRALSELASHHAELDVINPDTNEDFSPEARTVWESFFKGYECEELEKEMEKGVELLIEKELHPERFSENEDDFAPYGRRVPKDELKMEMIYWDNRELKDKVRKSPRTHFAYDRFIRARRLYLMYAYDAPEALIEREARRLARYMALNRYCEMSSENYWP